jgi:DNA-binding GntR family transcriptional regulator
MVTKTKAASLLEQRDTALQDIRRAIITGRYPPGYKLVEAALCAEYSIKRSRVRGILQVLSQEGFVNSVPYAGCVVSALSQKDIAQIYDLLGVLEGLSVRVATPMFSDEEIDRLEDMVHAIQDARDNPEEMFKRNREFHQCLTESSGNERLGNFAALLRQHNRRFSQSFFYFKDNVEHSLERNMRIITALRSRDGLRAEQVIRQHYIDARDATLKAFNGCV